jgi:hypothetical protein
VETWPNLYDGYTNNVVTNGSWVTTNIYPRWKSVTLTNQFGPYTYSLTGGGTATSYFPITRGLLEDLDTTLEALIPKFVHTNGLGTNADWSAVWDSNDFDLTDIPMQSKAGIMSRQGIGFVTNTTTNAVGFVTGGDSYWTRQPARTSNWVLASIAATNNSTWVFRDNSTFDQNFYGTERPKAIVYGYTGTVDIVVTGTVLNATDYSGVQGEQPNSESVTATTNGAALTSIWYNVANITSSGTAVTGAVVAVEWDDVLTTYRAWSWTHFVETLDERATALKTMVWTTPDNNNDYESTWIIATATGSGTNEAASEADFDSNWPSSVTTNTTTGLQAWMHYVAAHWSEGDWDTALGIYTPWSTSGTREDMQPVLTNLPSNVQCSIDMYLYATYEDGNGPQAGAGIFRDIDGFGFTSNKWKLAETLAEGSGTGRTFSWIYASTNYSSNPRVASGGQAPVQIIGTKTSLVEQVSVTTWHPSSKQGFAIIKCDGANGFQYK